MCVEVLRDRAGVYGVCMTGGQKELHTHGRLITRPDRVLETSRYASYQFIQPIHRYSLEVRFWRLLHDAMLARHGFERIDRHLSWWSDDPKQQAANRRIYFGLKQGAKRIVNSYLAKAFAVANLEALQLTRRYPFDYRSDLYAAFCDHPYARQLGDVFPALALMAYTGIYAGDNADGVRHEARTMIRAGRELKDIARLFDLPMAFRRFKPAVADRALRTLCLDNVDLIHAYCPTTTHGQRLWLTALPIAKGAGQDYLRWVAKNSTELAATKLGVRHMVEDIMDWAKASAAAGVPQETWECIGLAGNPRAYSRTISSIIRGSRHVTRRFNPEMSRETVLQLSDEWHDAIADADHDGQPVSFPDPWYDGDTVDGYQIIPITDSAELYQEGRRMRHCIAQSMDQVRWGQMCVYTVLDADKHIATFNLIRTADIPNLDQLRGPCNRTVAKPIAQAVRKWLRWCNRKHGRGRCPEVARR